MAAKRPQVAGQVDLALLQEIEALPLSKAKVVEWCLNVGVPMIKQAVQTSKGGLIVLPAAPSKHLKPQSKKPL